MGNVAKRDDDPGALAHHRPSFIETEATGTEDIGQDDIKLPCLKIAQGLSPQMVPDNSARIEGLQLFDFFNDLTETIYKRYEQVNKDGFTPLTLVVCKRQVKRIKFDEENRNIPLDLNVPANSPDMDWTEDEDGNRIPPRATKFVEFVCLLVTGKIAKDKDGDPVFNWDESEPEPIVISIKETNRFNKLSHERLSGFIKLKRPAAPIYAGVYTCTPGTGKNDKGTFGIFRFGQCGFVQEKPLYDMAKDFAKSLEGKEVTVQREPGDEDFNPADLENEDPSGM